MKKTVFDGLSRFLLPLYEFSGGIEHAPSGRTFKILIIKPDHLGDVILTTPALALIKRKWPESEVWFAGKKWLLPVLEGNPHIDRRIPFSPPWGTHNTENAMATPTISRLSRLIRKERFNMSISFQDAPANHLFTLFCGIPQRAGYAPRGGKHLLTICPEAPSKHEHALNAHLRLAESVTGMSMDTKDPLPEIFITTAETDAARQRLLSECSIDGNFTAFHIGAGNPGKEVSIEKASEIALSVVRKTQLHLLLVAGPGEEERLNLIVSAMKNSGAKKSVSNRISTVSSLNVRELAAILGQATVFIGHDSGPSHVAAAMAVPVISLWGPGNPAKWSPAGKNTMIVRHQICENPPERPICMNCRCLDAITGEEVGTLCNTIISSQGCGSP